MVLSFSLLQLTGSSGVCLWFGSWLEREKDRDRHTDRANKLVWRLTFHLPSEKKTENGKEKVVC